MELNPSVKTNGMDIRGDRKTLSPHARAKTVVALPLTPEENKVIKTASSGIIQVQVWH
jgi:hypothetical protein